MSIVSQRWQRKNNLQNESCNLTHSKVPQFLRTQKAPASRKGPKQKQVFDLRIADPRAG